MSDATNLTTAEGLGRSKPNSRELEGEGRREIAERIKTAREWGDLKENSEYHDAKNEQAHLETKIARLREKIARGHRRGGPAVAGGSVGFGSTVVVRDQEGAEQTWRIVSSHDAARRGPAVGRIAGRRRPVGRSRATRLRALPRGKRTLTVLSVG